MKVIWDINSNCNLRCLHCYNKNYELAELDIDEIEKIIKDTHEYVEFYQILGGEFFMRSDHLEVLSLFDSFKAKYTIITNGTLLTELEVEKLFKTSLNEIVFSLEGSSPNINDKVRGAGTFKKVSDTLRLMNQLDPTVTRIKRILSVTVQRYNLHDAISLLTYAKDMSVSLVLFVPLERTEDNYISQDLSITRNEWFEFLQDICIASSQLGVPINFPSTPLVKGVFRRRYNANIMLEKRYTLNSDVFRNIYIRSDGYVFPTFRYLAPNNTPLVNICDVSFPDFLAHPLFLEYQEKIESMRESLSNYICDKCLYNLQCINNVDAYYLHHDALINECKHIALWSAGADKTAKKGR